MKFLVKVGTWHHTCGGRGQCVFRRRVSLRSGFRAANCFNGGTRKIKSTTVTARTTGLPSSLNLAEEKKWRKEVSGPLRALGERHPGQWRLWTHQDHQDGGGALWWVLILLMKILSFGTWHIHYNLSNTCTWLKWTIERECWVFITLKWWHLSHKKTNNKRLFSILLLWRSRSAQIHLLTL